MSFFRTCCALLLIALSGYTHAATPLSVNSAALLQQRFDHYGSPGAWLLQHDGGAVVCQHGSAFAQLPLPPASSIKPLLALIALQTGALKSADERVPWNKRRYPNRPEWEKDMALNEAMRSSSESYFGVLAIRIGSAQLAAWIRKIGYGNGRIGPQPDSAWHDGVLSITAVQQLDFIERLRTQQLPFAARHLAAVKAAMLQTGESGQRLYAKSGTHLNNAGAGVGWWVGWVERGSRASSFVLAVKLSALDSRAERIALADQLLRDCDGGPK